MLGGGSLERLPTEQPPMWCPKGTRTAELSELMVMAARLYESQQGSSLLKAKAAFALGHHAWKDERAGGLRRAESLLLECIYILFQQDAVAPADADHTIPARCEYTIRSTAACACTTAACACSAAACSCPTAACACSTADADHTITPSPPATRTTRCRGATSSCGAGRASGSSSPRASAGSRSARTRWGPSSLGSATARCAATARCCWR